MTATTAWRHLCARIDGLARGSELYSARAVKTDSYGVSRELLHQARLVSDDIRNFGEKYAGTLPATVQSAIQSMLATSAVKQLYDGSAGLREAEGAVVVIKLVESEISFLLSDQQETIRKTSYRALQHLQRTLIADKVVQKAWSTAFATGEPACEGLGAAHMLLHGIFAFKINTAGARTDLTFQEPVDIAEVERGSIGLVLTEWKVADDDKDGRNKFAEAKAQAELYVEDALASLELRTHRYLIVVSEKKLAKAVIPADDVVKGVTYHHVNIAIAPDTPSITSKKKKAQS